MGRDKEKVTYTMAEIEEHWEGYKTKKGLKVLSDGKWMLVYPAVLNGRGGVDGTKAESVKLHQVMGFPTYLKKYAEL